MLTPDEGKLVALWRNPVRTGAVLALGLVLACTTAARAAIQTQYVVIVGIDGERYSETFGNPGFPWCPRRALDLATIGARPAQFRNVGLTITNPGFSTIVTGTLQTIANDGSERPHKPTLFEYLRQQKGTPAAQVRLVVRKAKLDVLAYSDHPDYGAAYGGTVQTGYANDAQVYQAARTALQTYQPVLTFVHFGEPDLAGHANNWLGYLAGMRVADSLTWRLWNDIQAIPAMAGKTTLFVSNDHGRHDDAHGGFQNHGDSCEGCRRIHMIMAGPDNYTNFTSAAVHEQRAIARTAGYLLGLSLPLADGDSQVMDDLLLEPSTQLAVPGNGPSPSRWQLSVFPNPTRAGAEVRVSGAAAEPSRVEVLDAHGRRVARLLHGGGARSWTWNGTDEAGRRVPPGRYIVRVTSRGEVQQVPLVKLH